MLIEGWGNLENDLVQPIGLVHATKSVEKLGRDTNKLTIFDCRLESDIALSSKLCIEGTSWIGFIGNYISCRSKSTKPEDICCRSTNDALSSKNATTFEGNLPSHHPTNRGAPLSPSPLQLQGSFVGTV